MAIRNHRVRALTLVEILLAVTVLGLSASSILACVTASAQRMKEVEQREAVLGYVTSQVEALGSVARKPAAVTLSNSFNVAVPGILEQVTITRKIETVAGNADLLYVEVTGSWKVSSTKNNRPQSITVSTYVRTPYG